jgi:hypothetical protein
VTCLALTSWYSMRKNLLAERLPSSLAEARV